MLPLSGVRDVQGGGATLLCVAWKREKVGEGGKGGGLALTEGPG